MSFAKMTLIGLTNWANTSVPPGPDNDLWDLMNLPEGIDKNTVINNIIMKGGEFEVLYPNYNYMRAFIGVWSNKHYRTFQKWITALNLTYNPLENYNRTEEYTDIGTNGSTRTGSRSNSISGSDTIKNTGTQSNQTVYNTHDEEYKTGTDTITRTDNLSESIQHNSTVEEDKLQTTKTNGTVTQSKDTKNNQTQTLTNTDLGTDHARSISAFNSSTLVPDSQDSTSGANTAVTTYSGQADNETTQTSVSYAAGTNGDTVIEDNVTVTSGTDIKSNTGTETNATQYGSIVNHNKTGNDTDTRTDNLTETKTSTLTDTGSDSDTISGNSRMEHRAHLYGNIGVTTSQQMLQAELDISAWNIYEKITDLFLDEFCIKVY